jgi:hypothetical protein
MINKFELAAAHIARTVPAAEASLDEALISVSSLIKTMVEARKNTGVAPSTGQGTLVRLVKAQMALVGVSTDVLRAHKDLSNLAEVHAGADLHECPKVSGRTENVTELRIAS